MEDLASAVQWGGLQRHLYGRFPESDWLFCGSASSNRDAAPTTSHYSAGLLTLYSSTKNMKIRPTTFRMLENWTRRYIYLSLQVMYAVNAILETVKKLFIDTTAISVLYFVASEEGVFFSSLMHRSEKLTQEARNSLMMVTKPTNIFTKSASRNVSALQSSNVRAFTTRAFSLSREVCPNFRSRDQKNR